MPCGIRAPSFQHHLRPTASAFCFHTDRLDRAGCGDRGCVTGDHLPIRGLRYPSGVRPRPGDPDGVLLLTFRLLVATSRHSEYCSRPAQPARAAVRPLPRPLRSLRTRDTLAQLSTNVYCRHDRFPFTADRRIPTPGMSGAALFKVEPPAVTEATAPKSRASPTGGCDQSAQRLPQDAGALRASPAAVIQASVAVADLMGPDGRDPRGACTRPTRRGTSGTARRWRWPRAGGEALVEDAAPLRRVPDGPEPGDQAAQQLVVAR